MSAAIEKTEKKDIDGNYTGVGYTGVGCVMLITDMTSQRRRRRRRRRRRCDRDTTTATTNDHVDHQEEKLDDRQSSRSIAGDGDRSATLYQNTPRPREGHRGTETPPAPAMTQRGPVAYSSFNAAKTE